ncbi:MAG: hypothetical protein NUV61_03455 [Candidatus Azambacteria bacterium]|nr:hypothetical protein [Candidatus Azambacteria bacterium]
MVKISEVIKKLQGVFPPPEVKTAEELLYCFLKEKVSAVTVEPACYGEIPGKAHRITIDYTGKNGKKKPVRRQEVLVTIKKQSTKEELLQEMRKLYPVIESRANEIRNILGICVIIPERFIRELAPVQKRSGTTA